MVGCWLLTRPLSLYPFTALVLLVGVTQGIGKASTIKYIPEYYPNDVGVVVGLVGALAAIGGFAMPPLFAYLKLWTGVPQAMFWLLFVLTATGLGWLHVVVRRLHRTEGASI
jgi:NNP family nitrate/nitrite transporter-like MFS transporter